ncbi:TrgA family protein [Frigidibacter sp. SD6-1]|uniref:TrgA family protein n=1 Tax=Frigidibacter sp. SD6-1 TaxID=3032581 RepID=UPI0024DF3AD7|nr:TrgA family protein [Frigidibacter sp. SD6-1]
MPTASKLFAAFGMALVAFLSAEIFKPHMPAGTQFGAFSPLSAIIGIVCGWRILGPATGEGWWPSANAGLRASLGALALALVLFSTEEMLVQAVRKYYDTPTEAIMGLIGIAAEIVQRMVAADFLLALLGGGMLAGVLSEWAGRRWS